MLNRKNYTVGKILMVISLGFISLVSAEPTKWVGTWSTAEQLVETGNNPPSPGLTNNTLRQIVRVSIGGDTLRMRFSNEFSTQPVTLNSVHIALSAGNGAIDTSTDRTLYFDNSPSVTMAAGAVAVSDPFPFALQPRTDLAITIYFGSTSTDVTDHPGSRTTSYLLTGNAVARADFTGAVTTDHWYNINTIEVLAPETAACVAILGNSITDGRGSTTNLQNRWTDIFSETLLQDSSTQHVGVLNLGIGGNCVLSGGLGPTAVSRFDRDILGQSEVRWAIVFEGVNDIGGIKTAAAANATANNLINAYKQMIVKAHANNIRIYGATITPFKGNSYYNQYSDLCRNTVNQWIRSAGNFDACIDFDKVMRNPLDTASLISSYQNDGLHPDAAGYVTMGESVNLDLFTGADTVFQVETGIESYWFEAERFVLDGSNFNLVENASASNRKYITVQAGVQALTAPPVANADLLTIPFTVTNDSIYHVFARLNCPTYDDDSFWVRMDDGSFTMCNGLVTSGWAWMKLIANNLTIGEHTLTIGYREDGACLDKLCITNNEVAPTGIGEVDSATLEVNLREIIAGYELGQNYPNPFNPMTTFDYTIPKESKVKLSVFDITGRLIEMLVNQTQVAGYYSTNWNAVKYSSGIYIYKIQAGDFQKIRKCLLIK